MVEGLKLWETVAVALAFILLAYFFLKMMAYVKVLSAVSGSKQYQAVSVSRSIKQYHDTA